MFYMLGYWSIIAGKPFTSSHSTFCLTNPSLNLTLISPFARHIINLDSMINLVIFTFNYGVFTWHLVYLLHMAILLVHDMH